MAHETAKQLLEQAETFLDRSEAVRLAMQLGMPLNEIEEYLDWLDFARRQSGMKGESNHGPSKAPK